MFNSQTSNIKPQTTNHKRQTSNLKPQTSNLKPQTSNLKLCSYIDHRTTPPLIPYRPEVGQEAVPEGFD